MRIKTLRVKNFKSIADSGWLSMGHVNVFVGRNNSGKSALLMALASIQAGTSEDTVDELTRLRSAEFEIRMTVDDPTQAVRDLGGQDPEIVVSGVREQNQITISSGVSTSHGRWSGHEPAAPIYPILGRRRWKPYVRAINQPLMSEISSSMHNLTAKIQRLLSTNYPERERFQLACENVIGFVPDVITVGDGQVLGRYVDQHLSLDIEAMGEGVHSALGALATLFSAEHKLILFEEPETDLHPSALKALLDVLVEVSIRNQIFVTTHSHIVVSHLASAIDTCVFEVTSTRDDNGIDTTSISPTETTRERIRLLRALGNDASDLMIYDAWLILEESSLETLVREHLVPWFAPRLQGRLRSIASDGADDVEPRFVTYRRLVTFAHLDEHFHGRAWVILDDDEAGRRVVEKLKTKFKDWPPDRFSTHGIAALEDIYPGHVRASAGKKLDEIPKGSARQAAKTKMLDALLDWIATDEDEAKNWARTSLSMVLEVLREIEGVVTGDA